MKHRDMVGLLEDAGFTNRGGANHDRYEHYDGRWNKMQYTYEFEVFENDGWLVAYPFDMDGGTQANGPEGISLMASEWLHIDIEHRLMHGLGIPEATFGNQPQMGGYIMVVSIEASVDTIRKVSASEAARMLNVSPARITHMIRDRLLEAYKDGHKTWVTLDSVNLRLKNPVPAGRPRSSTKP